MKNKIYVCVLLLFIIVSGYLLSFLHFSEVVMNENPVITFKHDYGYEYLDSTQATLYDKLSKRDMELNEIYLLDQEYDYDYIQKVLELYRTNNWDLCNDYCYGAIQEPTEMWNYGPLPVSKIKAVRVSYPIENYEEKVKQREELANEVLSKIPENTSDIEDCTWDDDPSNRYTYFLLSDEELNFLRYNEIREYSQDIPVPKAESSLWNK